MCNKLDKLNARYAYIGAINKVIDMFDQDDVTLMSPQAFQTYHNNEKATIEHSNGDLDREPLGSYWLRWNDRRTYHNITFDPSRDNPQLFNLWQGHAVKPSPSGSCDMFLDHIRENVCHGNQEHFEFFMGWAARMIQNPCKKSRIAVALTSPEKQVGKTVVGEVLGKLLGKHWKKVSNQKHLTGQFNAHFEGCILLQSEEAFWAGDKQARGTIKDLVTSSRVMIERKGIDPRMSINCVHLLLTSNEERAVPKEIGDTRFAVFKVLPARKGDHAYWDRMFHELENGGYERLLHELLSWDISGRLTLPETAEGTNQLVESPVPVNESETHTGSSLESIHE